MEVLNVDGVRLLVLHRSKVKKEVQNEHVFTEFYFGYCLDYGLFCIADNMGKGRLFNYTLDFDDAWLDYLSYFSNSFDFWIDKPKKKEGKKIKAELLNWRCEQARRRLVPAHRIETNWNALCVFAYPKNEEEFEQR